jgi:hypothetical protein
MNTRTAIESDILSLKQLFLILDGEVTGLAFARVKDTPDYSNVKKRRLAHLTDIVVEERHRGDESNLRKCRNILYMSHCGKGNPTESLSFPIKSVMSKKLKYF